MENKYLIIKKDGKIEEIQNYLANHKSAGGFAVFVQREALGQNVKSENMHSDYLYYAQKLGFNWEPNADSGLAQYDYRANLIMRLVKEYARSLVAKIGFPVYEVQGSNMFDLDHPVVEAYAKLYGDRLFNFPSGKKHVVMSYDASYPQFNLAGKYNLNHRQLPFAHFSISDCYRHEQSGECMLLYRQRRFFMPDLHPYFKDLNEAFAWFPKIEKLLLDAAREVGIDYHVVIEVSSEQYWNQYREQIMAVAKNLNKDVLIAIIQDGKDRYWIINVDYKIVDKLGQSREICCIQIDVGNAKRLGIQYVDANGKKVHPVIIHSAVPGGIERFLYMLFDDFKNRFPIWLYPAHIRLLPVNQNLVPECEKFVERYKDRPVRIEIDDRAESISNKLRLAHKDLIPFSIVIGEKEFSSGDFSLLNSAVEKVAKFSNNKPFLQMQCSNKVGLQVR